MRRRPSPRLLATLLALVAATILAAPVAAAPSPAQQQQVARDAESRLMCVTCNTPLNQSEATQANRERTEIERLAARGLNADQVVDRMVEIYGENVLIDPPDDTVRLLRWLLPTLGALAAAALLTVLVRRWRRRRSTSDDAPFSSTAADHATAPDAPDAPSGEDERRLDADLARYR